MLLTGAGYGGLRLREHLLRKGAAERTAAAVAATQVAWPKLARCLLGDAPKGTRPSDWMRRVELAQLAGATSEDPWPTRCRPAVVATIDAIEGLEEPEAIASHQPLRHLLALERDASAGDEPSHTYLTTVGSEAPPVDRMVQIAAKLGLGGPAPSTDLPDPPAGMAPATLPERSLGSASGHWQRIGSTPSAEIRFVFGDGDHHALACRLATDGRTLACSAKERAWTTNARPLSAESEGGELWVWDDGPNAGLMRPRDGDRASGPFGPDAFVREKGAITGMTLVEGSEDVMFARYDGETGAVDTRTVTPPDGATWLGQRADVAAWLGKADPEGDGSQRPLLVQTIVDGGEVGEAQEIGSVPEGASSLLACRRGDWLGLGVLGPLPKFGDAKDAKTTISVAFRGAKEWKPPVTIEVALERKRNSLDDRWRLRQSCREGGMAITWLREDDAIGQVRCTPKGCTEERSQPLETVGTVDHLDFGALDGEVLVATTRHAPSPLTATVRGVFFRIAPVAEIATAPDQVVIGDELHGGVAKVHERLGIITAGDRALLLVSGNEQLYAFGVAADGTVTNLSPESL